MNCIKKDLYYSKFKLDDKNIYELFEKKITFEFMYKCDFSRSHSS